MRMAAQGRLVQRQSLGAGGLHTQLLTGEPRPQTHYLEEIRLADPKDDCSKSVTRNLFKCLVGLLWP